MKALILEGILPKTKEVEELESKVEILTVSLSDILDEKYPEAEILFTRIRHYISTELLSKLPKLKYLLSPTTGLDHINLDFCALNKIEVISVKGRASLLKNITSTSEVAWWHILELNRFASKYQDLVDGGIWDRDFYKTKSLNGKILGICGYGRLGKQMAVIGKAFGMQILAFDKLDVVDAATNRASSLMDLLNESQIVTFHIDANNENSKLINRNLLFQIENPELLLVNTSRGSIVDENAIVEAMQNGRIGGYGCDVLTNESQEQIGWLESNPLWKGRKNDKMNITLTPHIGGATEDSLTKVQNDVVVQLLSRLKIQNES
jgi:D-3-phosphoglycerate dehydrogenase